MGRGGPRALHPSQLPLSTRESRQGQGLGGWSRPGDLGKRRLAALRGWPTDQRAPPALSAHGRGQVGTSVPFTYTGGPGGSGRSARRGRTPPSHPHTSRALEKSQGPDFTKCSGLAPLASHKQLSIFTLLAVPARSPICPPVRHCPQSQPSASQSPRNHPRTLQAGESLCPHCADESTRGQRN